MHLTVHQLKPKLTGWDRGLHFVLQDGKANEVTINIKYREELQCEKKEAVVVEAAFFWGRGEPWGCPSPAGEFVDFLGVKDHLRWGEGW